MSTRGLMGFYADGVTKGTYNHFDSYPSGLGADIAADIETMLDDGFDIADAIRKLESVEHDERLEAIEGKAYEVLKGGVFHNSNMFLAVSLACEWAYIINADDETVEVYRGVQEKPHTMGRYADLQRPLRHGGYYPCALVKTIPWSYLGEEDWTTEGMLREEA